MRGGAVALKDARRDGMRELRRKVGTFTLKREVRRGMAGLVLGLLRGDAKGVVRTEPAACTFTWACCLWACTVISARPLRCALCTQQHWCTPLPYAVLWLVCDSSGIEIRPAGRTKPAHRGNSGHQANAMTPLPMNASRNGFITDFF